MNRAERPVIGARFAMPGVVYPPREALERYVQAGELPVATLVGAYLDAFERFADQLAIIGPEATLTYRQLDERTDRLAAALMTLGAKPLDRAIFQMANSTELLVATIACLKAGVIPVCTLATHRELEIGSLGRHAEATLWFVDGDDEKFDLRAFAQTHRAAIPSIAHVIVARGAPLAGQIAMSALIEAQSAAPARAQVRECVAGLDPFQPAVFQLSGGTTGVSKIIPRFSNDYLCNMRRIIAATERSQPEVVFSGGPHLHNAGFVCHWGPGLLIGSAILVTRDYTEDGLLDAFLTYRPTWGFIPKPLLLRLVAGKNRRGADLSFMRIVATMGGAPTIRKEIGARPMSVFGMAEGPVMVTTWADTIEALDETVGRPISTLDEIRLVKPETMEDVPEGEMGELIVRGPYTLHGYYKADEKNRESFTPDGYLRTGDLLLRKQVGGNLCYQFQGRIKDIVKRAGETISCEEIERVVRHVPGVADCAVVPVSDPVYIERACACLILHPGAGAPSIASLGEHLARAGLAKFKWPEHVQIFESFPLTKSGKLSKPLLREQATERITTATQKGTHDG